MYDLTDCTPWLLQVVPAGFLACHFVREDLHAFSPSLGKLT